MGNDESDFWAPAGHTPPPIPTPAPPPTHESQPAGYPPSPAPVIVDDEPAAPDPVSAEPIPRYGGVSAPRYVPTYAAMPVQHRPWSTFLLGFHGLNLVGGVLTLIAGVLLATSDAAANLPLPVTGGEVAAVGVAVAIAGLVIVAIALTLTLLTHRGRRNAEDGRPGLLRGIALTAAILGTLQILAIVSGAAHADASVFALIGALVLPGLYTFAGVRTFLAART